MQCRRMHKLFSEGRSICKRHGAKVVGCGQNDAALKDAQIKSKRGHYAGDTEQTDST